MTELQQTLSQLIASSRSSHRCHHFSKSSAMSTPRSPDGPGATTPCQPSSSVESSAYVELDPDPGLLLPVSRSPLLSRRLLRLRTCSSHVSTVTRRRREMVPADKKDNIYWDKRRKNNEAAKRSREKRRLNDLMLESQLLALSEENTQLRAQVLSLQYHSSLSAEKSKPAASTLSLSPRPAASLQAGLWGNSRSNPAHVRQQETGSHPFESKVSCFRGVGNGFDPQSPHGGLLPGKCATQQGVFPLSVPGRVLSPRAGLEGGRSAEAEMDTQRQVSSSDDIPNSIDSPSHPTPYIQAFLPSPGSLHQASALSYPPQNWLVPHLNHTALCNNLLLPWRSSYLAPPAVYPGLPLYVQERQGQGLGMEADIQRAFKSPFGSAPAGLSPLRMHLSPDGR
ncbi:nuclear factor interleukin-3-regulated protein [Thunnus maccoyii]|uniref:nuclear factor interleukin-3-regulated protein n=1 Tax=Thunnus maccoyii TaxID=8240 RepID=UPI001C4C6783|nr:nuclear factor interleukin-3-regulated protein [Thunnus maccoyii]